MPEFPFTDMHCHPSLKPFGRSFPGGVNHPDANKESSIWHRKSPSLFTKIINKSLTLTRFTQSDFTSLVKGGIRTVCISLYPVERGFLVSKLGEGPLADIVYDWIMGIGKAKVDFLQQNTDYYSELRNEMNFYEQLHDHKVRLGLKKWKYRLVANYQEIIENAGSAENIISVIPSIEGGHAFISDNRNAPDTHKVMENINEMLGWKYKPLFVSPAHHFYNYLCGHAYSLSTGLRLILDQKTGANTGITPLGWKVIEKLLSNKIWIDIKHMSRQSRREYYKLLRQPEKMNVPVVVSHGAVNGRPTVGSSEDHGEENGKFYGTDINFYDDELVVLAKSKGIFCIQLDERRIVSRSEKIRIKDILLPAKKAEARAGLVWNQIEHIVRTLDAAGLDAWDCISIGSDHDGIIDPLDGFWTAKEIVDLRRYLLIHAKRFSSSAGTILKKQGNIIPPETMINRICHENAQNFLKNFFN